MDPSQPHFGLYMTMIGMGTVFTTLLLLAIFMFVFNRIFARAGAADAESVPPSVDAGPPVFEPSPHAAPLAPEATASPPAATVDPVTHSKRKRAAAIAVAVLLAARAKHNPLFRPISQAGSAWRHTYRQRFLIGRRR